MFIREEIEGKKAKVRKLLDELGLDGILLKKISNFAWLTGGAINYVGITSEVGICTLAVTRNGDYVISNVIEGPRLRDEEELVKQGYQQKTYPWHNDNGETEIVAAILPGGKIGSDFGYPGSTDVNGKLNELRWSLDQWEIERYRELGRKTSLAIEEVIKAVRPGDKECTIVGRLLKRLWEDRIDHINTFCAADDRIGRFRHPIATERTVDKRCMLCVNSRHKGLIISLTRFVQFGKVPEDIRKKYDDNVRIDCVFMANSRPGTPLAEVFGKGIQAYKDLGYDGEFELHHQGGAIGYVGRESRVKWDTPGVVFENQAFAWNPSITGSKSEDVMLATATGPELLSYPIIHPELELEVDGVKFVRPDILEL